MLTKNDLHKQKEDPRVTRTRALLVRALTQLMGEKDFESISIREIAERATLNRVTFYAHFQDKYDLLEYAMRQMVRDQVTGRLADTTTYSDEALSRLMRLVCAFLAEMDSHCPPPHGKLEILMEKLITSELFDRLRAWLHTGATAGRPHPDQAATVAAWAIYGAAQQWSKQERKPPADDFVRQVFPLIAANLQPFVKLRTKKVAARVALGKNPSAFLAPHFRLRLFLN